MTFGISCCNASPRESIESNDEVTLPGMGVFFEIVWQGADQSLKNQILQIIKERVSQGENNKDR